MEKEIARANNFIVTMQLDKSGEPKFCLRYLEEPDSKLGILAIQRAFAEDKLRSMASAFQDAVRYIDRR